MWNEIPSAVGKTAAKGAKVVLEVGANAGIYRLAALAIPPDAIVRAFEPAPEIAARLRETAKVNGLQNLYVHQLAVSRKNGQAILKRFRGELGINEGMNFRLQDTGDANAERVQIVCLDQFCQRHSITHVDLLNDIQENEYSTLAGAECLIMPGRVGIIVMELNWSTPPGATSSAISCSR